MKEDIDMEKIHAVKTSLFGKGSIALLPDELKKRGLTRGLIVTDSFLYKSGAADRVGEAVSAITRRMASSTEVSALKVRTVPSISTSRGTQFQRSPP